MSILEKHLNNYNEIKNSKTVGCLACCKVSNVDELDWLADDFNKILDLNTYCPKCRVADQLIGDASNIDISEANLRKLHDESNL